MYKRQWFDGLNSFGHHLQRTVAACCGTADADAYLQGDRLWPLGVYQLCKIESATDLSAQAWQVCSQWYLSWASIRVVDDISEKVLYSDGTAECTLLIRVLQVHPTEPWFSVVDSFLVDQSFEQVRPDRPLLML